MSPTTSTEGSATYPPQNSLQAALQHREETDSLATVQLDERRTHPSQRAEDADDEAMRLRGGCINLAPCGCPDCSVGCLPCTIA